jgi:deazaflavin-dependent oxidoreductase (nitroreductase family)
MTEREVKPFTPQQVRIAKRVMRIMSKLTVWAYRASNGKLGGRFLHGAPVCLLSMTGRKTGKRLTVPLIYTPHDDDVLMVASQGGLDRHPVWYLNLLADPDVEIQVGATTRSMVTRQASDEEKQALWPVLVEVYPDFEDYQRRTKRNIPVMICSPR